MPNPPFDLPRAHRWFAMELNNLAWTLVEKENLAADQIDRMIHAAHAACFHWLEVGDLLNHLRAQCLIATAYAKAGLSDSALCHAEKCLALSRQAGNQQTNFDLATAHGCASAAYKLAGQMDKANSEHQLSRPAAMQCQDPSELPLIEKLYPAP